LLAGHGEAPAQKGANMLPRSQQRMLGEGLQEYPANDSERISIRMGKISAHKALKRLNLLIKALDRLWLVGNLYQALKKEIGWLCLLCFAFDSGYQGEGNV
jgi:hypothetical protein